MIVCESGKSLSALVDERIKLFPASGEINRKLPDGRRRRSSVSRSSISQGAGVDYADGLSMEFDRWRFNLRTSDTELLVRLNVESRGDEGLMKAKTEELLKALEG